jgi:hypothetical protein
MNLIKLPFKVAYGAREHTNAIQIKAKNFIS